MKKSFDKCIIFLNGQKPSKKLFRTVDFSLPLIICVDGALDYFIKSKPEILPHIVMGDFDSVNTDLSKLYNTIQIIKFPTDKDYTDGYLAVEEAVKRGAEQINIFGAFGGRKDHELNNYSLLTLAHDLGAKACLKDEKFDVYLSEPVFRLSTKTDKIISVVPLSGDTHILYTKGLKYPAENITVSNKNPLMKIMGISNRADGSTIEIGFGEGKALVFVER